MNLFLGIVPNDLICDNQTCLMLIVCQLSVVTVHVP